MRRQQNEKDNRSERKREPGVVTAELVGEPLRRRFLLLRYFDQPKNAIERAPLKRRVARMTACPSRLSVPPLTTSPICFTTGMDSPVNADSSADVAPSMITPSTGKSSPALTSSSSTGSTSSTEFRTSDRFHVALRVSAPPSAAIQLICVCDNLRTAPAHCSTKTERAASRLRSIP